MCVLEYRRTAIAMNKPPKSGLAFDADFEHPTCKGKSFNPLCCYSYLIADLAVLKWNTVCIFGSMIVPCLNAFALSGRHYISSCEPRVSLRLPWAMCLLGFQPALAKSETSVSLSSTLLPLQVGCSKSEYLTRPIFVCNVLKM